jgi:LAS superfamily LD-carboxypeptidase LdcB
MEHKHYNNDVKTKNLPPYAYAAGIVFIVLGGFLLFEIMQVTALANKVDLLAQELAITNGTLSLNTRQFSKNVTDLNEKTLGLSDTITNTQQNIDAVKSQVGGVQQTIGSISSTVGNLQKLAEVDPYLLKKYSKVYFMNENYVPAHLISIPQNYVYSSTRSELFVTESWPYLKNLFDQAKADGVTLYVKSAYRSFAEQKSLKSSYSITYGAGTANSFSADQGYSEHQLGTTLDFITTGLGGKLTSFDTTQAYQWLLNNGYKYGFIISYPKNNKYYIYEPWHWRFVGVKLATYLHNNNLHFYDFDQREIDKYLINTFD